MDDKPPKSSKKKVILIVLAVLLIGGGVAAYFVNKNNQDEKAQKAAETSEAANTNQASNTKTLEAASTSGKPFVATVNTTINGKDVTGIMSSDGQGNVSYVYKADGKDISLIYTADAYYLCSGTETCLKYAASKSSSSGFDPSTYQFDSSRLNALKNTAAYQGQQTCPTGTGTCDVWSVTSGSTTTTMYVNASTKQIAKVTTKSGTTTSDITYEYKAVTVAAPTNSVTLPTQ